MEDCTQRQAATNAADTPKAFASKQRPRCSGQRVTKGAARIATLKSRLTSDQQAPEAEGQAAVSVFPSFVPFQLIR
jgi:hypothetical protein